MNRLTIQANRGKQTINRHIYGHFAEHLGRCFYDGIWVGEESSIPNTRGIRNDVVEALKKLNIPNLRWPGGCFADDYHWRDGIGPKEQRPRSTNMHWGKVVENNHFGTHEFLELCEQLDCEPYIAGNVGTGTPQEMRDWLEYLTFDGDSTLANERRKNGREKPWNITYWGVGNENWGCGGNMRPEYYADVYRRFATYCRRFDEGKLYRIAGGPPDEYYQWTEVLMKEAAKQMEGLSLHYYTMMQWENKQTATQFDEAEWFAMLKKGLYIDTVLANHSAIMDRYDPEKRVGLIVDEWGAWHKAEEGTNPAFLYQQNSLRDALLAGLTLHIFHNHADRVQMANIAQTVNVLQAMVLTEGEKMLLTPTYHVFEMYKGHQGATLLPILLQSEDYTFGEASIPAVSASASRNDSGEILLTLCHLNPNQAIELSCVIDDAAVKQINGRLLTAAAMDAHNNFDAPETIAPTAFDGAALDGDTLKITLPAKSVVALTLK